MGRYQAGYIYEAANAFHVRFYTTEIVDGQPKRVQRSKRLCTKDDKHHSTTCKPVRLLCKAEMDKINEPTAEPDQTLVVTFWDDVYLPFIEENLRYSTVDGYKKIWNQFLKDHFANVKLNGYRTHMGSAFLTGLSKSLGRRTLAHIRSLASGIFSHAVNTGLLESNPWHDVKILGKVKPNEPTAHYTLEEAENIISALIEHMDCQLIVALAFFLGLRPGEIAGLKWGDIEEEWLHIRRAVVCGKVGETKTPESVARLPLIQPLKGIIVLWRQKSGNPSEGWVFPNRVGNPIDLEGIARRIIIPTLAKKNIEWKGFYAGRRGAGTILTQLTGSAIAAQQILRHKNLAVTTGFYVKEMPEVGMSGMKLLEAAATNRAEV